MLTIRSAALQSLGVLPVSVGTQRLTTPTQGGSTGNVQTAEQHEALRTTRQGTVDDEVPSRQHSPRATHALVPSPTMHDMSSQCSILNSTRRPDQTPAAIPSTPESVIGLEATPPTLHESSPAVETEYKDSLTVEEIIAMIVVYRGRDDGLWGQSNKSLRGLLKFYEVGSMERYTSVADNA